MSSGNGSAKARHQCWQPVVSLLHAVLIPPPSWLQHLHHCLNQGLPSSAPSLACSSLRLHFAMLPRQIILEDSLTPDSHTTVGCSEHHATYLAGSGPEYLEWYPSVWFLMVNHHGQFFRPLSRVVPLSNSINGL